jgi:hypothetical protein
MLTCTFLAVCERVIEDADTRTWTAVALVEQAGFDKFGVMVPWSTISYWELAAGASPRRECFVRPVLIGADGTRVIEAAAFPVTFGGGRTRLNLRGFLLPPGPGDYAVRMEWSEHATDGWHDAGQRWSLRLTASPPPQPSEPSRARH